MNMGGGILLRTVACAAGSTTPAASTGFCSACTGQAARPSSLRATCRTCHRTAHTASSSNQADLEDWEFAEDESTLNRAFSASNGQQLLFSHTPASTSYSSGAYVADDSAPFENKFWHVFGLPPSIDEANKATSELQAAFFSSNYVVADEMRSSCSNSTTLEEYGGCSSKGSDAEEEVEPADWVEPQPQPFISQLQIARSPVQEAFQLLQSDPNVKGAVISIVSDPEVWQAMMKNEKVQELKRIFQKSQEKGEQDMQEQQPPQKNHEDNCLDGVMFLLRLVAGMSRQVVWQVQDDISKIIMSIFSLVTGPKCGPEEEDTFDKRMRSSMMIAVLVVTIVLMKRVQV